MRLLRAGLSRRQGRTAACLRHRLLRGLRSLAGGRGLRRGRHLRLGRYLSAGQQLRERIAGRRHRCLLALPVLLLLLECLKLHLLLLLRLLLLLQLPLVLNERGESAESGHDRSW